MSLIFIVSSLRFCMQMYMYYVAIQHFYFERSSFSLKFLSFLAMSKSSHVRFCLIALEISIQLLFFQFFFLGIVVRFILVFFVLFVVVVSGLTLFFFMLSMRCHIDVSSMLSGPLSPTFLDIYSLSMTSLGCKAYCIIMNLLVLWSIFWRYFPRLL